MRQIVLTQTFSLVLGFQDRPNIWNLYHEYWLPTMSDPKLWATKSSDLLIAYFMCIFQYMYASGQSVSDALLAQLRKTLLIKTKQNKFLSLGNVNNFFHLTKTYGARCSPENLSLNIGSSPAFCFCSKCLRPRLRKFNFNTRLE